MSKEDAASALAVLTAAYNRELPKPTARLYIQALSDLPSEPLAKAVNVLIKSSRWFPTIADVRETTMEFDKSVSLPDSWDDAWAEVMSVVRAEGRHRTSEWSNPGIAEALKLLGGYVRVCEATSIGSIESRFKRAYEKTNYGRTRKALLGGDLSEESVSKHSDNSNVVPIKSIGRSTE